MVLPLQAWRSAPHIRLQAIDPSRNLCRSYEIERTRDLFGWHLVRRTWGRVGRGGTTRLDAFATEGEAQAFVAELLARRSTAPRRIGVAYRIVPDGIAGGHHPP